MLIRGFESQQTVPGRMAEQWKRRHMHMYWRYTVQFLLLCTNTISKWKWNLTRAELVENYGMPIGKWKSTTPVGLEPTTSELHLTTRSPTRYPLRHGASWLVKKKFGDRSLYHTSLLVSANQNIAIWYPYLLHEWKVVFAMESHPKYNTNRMKCTFKMMISKLQTRHTPTKLWIIGV